MRKENSPQGYTRRQFIRDALMATFFTVAIQPLQDLKSAGRVLDVISGNGKNVDCFDESISESNKYPYDAIIVLGAGIGITPEGIGVPNEYQKLRLEAAAISYIRKKASKIILLDGKIDSGIDPLIDQKYLLKLK